MLRNPLITSYLKTRKMVTIGSPDKMLLTAFEAASVGSGRRLLPTTSLLHTPTEAAGCLANQQKIVECLFAQRGAQPRLAQLNLSVRPNPRCKGDSIEISSPGSTYYRIQRPNMKQKH